MYKRNLGRYNEEECDAMVAMRGEMGRWAEELRASLTTVEAMEARIREPLQFRVQLGEKWKYGISKNHCE